MDFNIDEFIKKHDVHPETIAFLKAVAASGERSCHEIGVEAYRKVFNKRNKLMAGETVFEGSEIEMIVPSDDVKVKYKESLKECQCDLDIQEQMPCFNGFTNILNSSLKYAVITVI